MLLTVRRSGVVVLAAVMRVGDLPQPVDGLSDRATEDRRETRRKEKREEAIVTVFL